MKAIAARQSSNEVTRKHKVKEQTPGTARASVFSFPDIAIQRKPTCPCGGGCPRCGDNSPVQTEPLLRRSSANQVEPSTVPSIVHEVLRAPGWPLDSATRTLMEARFGHDFSHVRVHTDQLAARSAKAVAAHAYTVSSDVVFASGRYAPASHDGQRLLAHELMHVVQQDGARTAGPLTIQDVTGPAERTADQADHDALSDHPVGRTMTTGVTVARQPETGSYTSSPSLREQADTLLRMFSQLLMEADRDGYAGIMFVVANRGTWLDPRQMEKLKPQKPRPSGTAPLSEREAADMLRSYISTVSEFGPGEWKVEFGRDERGIMRYQGLTKLAEAPKPQPAASPAFGESVSEEEALAEIVEGYKAWYTFAQKHIAAGVAAQDPTKPENIFWAALPLAAVKVAKTLKLIEGAEDVVTVERQAERISETAKETRRARIIQRSEALRLERKYASRVKRPYPPETWDYIEQLEGSFPKLKGAQLRPLKRPATAEPWVFNERMQTSQGKFSFEGKLSSGERVQLDDITPNGWVVEVKLRNHLEWEDELKVVRQMERQSLFAKENGLQGVRWEVNNAETLKFMEGLMSDRKIRNIFPVLVE